MSEAPADDGRLRESVPLLFLPQEEAARLLAAARRATLGAGEAALTKGERPRELLIPLSALRETHDATGLWEPVPAFAPLGLYCLLNGQPAPATVVAERPTSVLALDWSEVRRSMERVRGLREHLSLVSRSPAAAELDRGLSELGCTPAFRAAFVGALSPRSWAPGSWLSRPGEVPQAAVYAALGTAQAHAQDAARGLSPAWVAPCFTWQLWRPCLDGSAPAFGLKAVTAVDGFSIERGPLATLSADFPADFALLSRNVATPLASGPAPEAQAVELDRLFPPPPRPVERRRRRPFVQQGDEMECGAACLAMLSKHFGNDLPLQYWWQRVGVGQEGCTLFDMARAAEKAGFICHGLEIPDLASLEPSLFPLVALRAAHFFVVYGVEDGKLVVADPAIGVSPMEPAEFAKGYTGCVLALKPTEAFYHESSPRRPYAQYLGMFEGHELELALVAATSLALTALSTLPAFVAQFIVDEVLGNGDARLLAVGLCAVLLMQGAQELIAWLRSYYVAFLSSRFDFGAASAFWRRLLSLPYDFFARRHVGDFTRRLSQLESVRRFAVSQLIGVALDLLNLLVYSVLLLLYSPKVAVAALLSAPALLGLSIAFSGRLRRQYDRAFRARADQDSLLADQIKGIATIKALGAETAARWRFEETLVEALRAEYRFDLSAAALGGLSSFVDGLIRLGILALAASIALGGGMTPGQVIAVSALAAGLVGPFKGIAGLWSEVQRLRVVLDRLNDVFLAEPETAGSARALVKKRLRGEVEFRNVWFRYGGESSEWALKGLSFRVLPGQKAAIVGPSGAGKSTVALLAARLYEPQQGSILVDGRDIREYDRQWLRSQIGLLLQEPNLFHGTLLENIAYADPRPDLARVRRCAETAGADEFIRDKAMQLDYMISHGGLGLSGGQKQRVAIARTLYAQPSLLFLDESTSFVDARTERGILAALQSGFEGRTIVTIAHRRQTIAWADFILVVDGGRVLECGTHAELSRAGGLYAELFQGGLPS